MQDNINLANAELEVRANKPLAIVLAWTVLVCFMAYDLRNQLFKWSDFNRNGINTILFLLFLLPGVFWWIKLFDNKPQILILKEGVRIRRNTFPFSSLRLIAWTEIHFFYLLKKTEKSVTGYYLIIGKKEREKVFKVELNGLDKSTGIILSIIRKYANIYGFQDLGKEYA